MLLELAMALLIGTLSGVFTGLAPGIHINLVATFLLSALPSLNFISPLSASVFIVSMSITHTFIDFIPSIFLGAPEEDTFLSILPGHQLMRKGLGYRATILTFYGCLSAIPGIILISILYITILPFIFPLIRNIMPYLLIFISSYLILRDKRIFKAFLIFILSGTLAYFTFNLNLFSSFEVKEPLLPLLSGLFGISSLIFSIKTESLPSKQKTEPLRNIKLPKHIFSRAVLASYISAPLCSFLPGIGSGHAAVIGSEIISQSRSGFLFLVGSLNTFVMGLSFATLFAINKARTGSAAAIQELFPKLNLEIFSILILTIIISGILAFILGILLSRLATKFINLLPYRKLNYAVIIIVIIVNIIFSNWLGLLVLILSTLTGILCIHWSVRRINLMGSLILSSILYYLSQSILSN